MNIKYVHIRDKTSPRGGCTLTMQVDEDNKVVQFALVFCYSQIWR